MPDTYLILTSYTYCLLPLIYFPLHIARFQLPFLASSNSYPFPITCYVSPTTYYLLLTDYSLCHTIRRYTIDWLTQAHCSAPLIDTAATQNPFWLSPFVCKVRCWDQWNYIALRSIFRHLYMHMYVWVYTHTIGLRLEPFERLERLPPLILFSVPLALCFLFPAAFSLSRRHFVFRSFSLSLSLSLSSFLCLFRLCPPRFPGNTYFIVEFWS